MRSSRPMLCRGCALSPWAVPLLMFGVTLRAEGQATEVITRARVGVYVDDNDTQVQRMLVNGRLDFGAIDVSVDEAIDVVTSSSIDVRSSPELDAVSSATQNGTATPTMSDVRYQTTLALAYDDDVGHRAAVAPTLAIENDYRSLGIGLRGSIEILDRHTTLGAALIASTDRATSVIDRSFSGTSELIGGSVSVAQVLSATQLLRVRYDGVYRQGYMASPYRAVRFGRFQTTMIESGAIRFTDTIGYKDGYPEKLPRTRMRHAIDTEWLAELWSGFSVLLGYRFASDDWGLSAHTLTGEVRIVLAEGWVLPIAYRYYDQGAADFWRGKYLMSPTTYDHYSADKELGDVQGDAGSVGVAYRWDAVAAGEIGGSIDLSAHLMRYVYPDFALLDQRTAVHIDLGLTLEL